MKNDVGIIYSDFIQPYTMILLHCNVSLSAVIVLQTAAHHSSAPIAKRLPEYTTFNGAEI